ncbi:MAG: hypothetical protein ACM3TT_11395 [Syntrophothermus sp.]
MKNRKIVIVFCNLVLMLISLSCTLAQENSRLKARDALQLNDDITVKITGVYYTKSQIAKQEEGEEITITDEQLKNIFLNQAVIIDGIEVNYVYLYEYVTIIGVIENNGEVYDFSYNLAGFGSIYIDQAQIPIWFGDPTKAEPHLQ